MRLKTAGITFTIGLAVALVGVTAGPQGEGTASAHHEAGTSPPPGAHADHGSSPAGVVRPGRPVDEAFPGWYHSDDFAVVGHGGTDGYRLAIAREREQFIARPLATIQPGGYDSDDWLGYQCVTGNRQHVVVTLMPRRAVNNQVARDRGALLYSVRVSDGSVRPLLWGVAMKGHAVNCGGGSLAAAVRHLDSDQRRSEVLLIDAGTGKVRSGGVAQGQLTWPVPVDGQTVLAVRDRSIELNDLATGRRTTVATLDGVPITLAASRLGVDVVAERPGGATVAAYQLHGRTLTQLGSGPAGDVRLVRAAAGQNLLFGITTPLPGAAARTTAKLRPVAGLARPEPVIASTRGGLVLAPAPGNESGWLRYGGDGGLVTGGLAWPERAGTVATTLPPGTPPAVSARAGEALAANSTNPTCGVPRNDPRRQAFGASHTQAQWAVEMASRNRLLGTNARPANHLQSGLPGYSPSSDFAIPNLLPGGGRVPPVVMNGILAQENNYQHASRRSLPGSGGNPAISDYYGSGGTLDLIDYSQSDCGYGIAQVTTGMRLSDTSISPNGKAKIAIDYAENIQAGMQILAGKWNQLYQAGIRLNNSNPTNVENWYFAIWAYNTGVQPDANHGNPSGCTPSPTCTDGAGHWGLGWSNNPMNPDYPPQREFFLRTTYADAEHPSDWPYQERVFGWMSQPIKTYKGDLAYLPVEAIAGQPVVEPLGLPNRTMFCSIVINNCDPTSAAGCQLADYHCWWNQPVSWPLDCATVCHVSRWTFVETAPEPSSTNPWPPACNSDLGPNAIIVDELANPAENLFCAARNWTNGGSFSYSTGNLGQIDFHQLATGFGAHTWFTGNRLATDTAHRVTGTWTPNNLTPGLYTVRAHIPVAGASATAANYRVTLADGSVREVGLNQHEHYNHWKSLGTFTLGANAKVVLDNVTRNDTAGGRTTVAFDAVAFVPTPGTYVERRVDAVAYFDEDIELRTNAPGSWTFGLFGSAQVAYDWAVGASAFAAAVPVCGAGQPTPSCVMPQTRGALLAWRANVLEAGTGHGLNHPTGKSVMQWLALANDYHDRPNSATRPSRFDTDDGSYKLRSSATVSFVIGPDGKIVPGSADANYDDRTADTHLPPFVVDVFKAVEQDYGITPPDLSYTLVNANEYDHQTTLATPNDDGIVPGRAFKHAGAAPVILDGNGLPTTSGGSCVMATYIAGGMIGYRPMIHTGYVPAAVLAWRNRVRDATTVPAGLKQLSVDIHGDFFRQPSLTITTPSPPTVLASGSPMGLAVPIWQELVLKVCADGTVRKTGTLPVLRASHMPNQYLYLDNESINLDGARSYSAAPVISGSFPNFTNLPDPAWSGYLWPNQYGNCDVNTGQNGNPWGIPATELGDLNPNSVHFCTFPSYGGEPEYS